MFFTVVVRAAEASDTVQDEDLAGWRMHRSKELLYHKAKQHTVHTVRTRRCIVLVLWIEIQNRGKSAQGL